ncbi:MAG: hypothetical protein QXX68_01075 [Candidatus Pacearchaeota archaeon]
MSKNDRRLARKIEDILCKMQHTVPLSSEWRYFEDKFFQLSDQFGSPRLKALYLRKYAYTGTNDAEVAEKSCKAILRSFREEIPDGTRFRNSLYEEIREIFYNANY